MTAILALTSFQRHEIVRQLGRDFWAISGGKVGALRGGIDLPCGAGYSVKIELDASDTYVVSRVYRRSGVEHAHGVRTNIGCEELAEVAFRASCFRDYDDEEW